MNQSVSSPAINIENDIKQRYEKLKQQEPNMRARNAAQKLGVTEGELLASRVGDDAIRLLDNAEIILISLSSLGEVMALTRNEYCVHERKGIYENPSFFGKEKIRHGLFVNSDIDLRLFMSHWRFNFAAIEQTRGGPRKSLQFFDKSGQAVHKIYLTSKSSEDAYDKLLVTHRHLEQNTCIDIKDYKKKTADRPDENIDWPALRSTWKNLKDTHDFLPMLKKFKVGRQQALRKIGSDLAYEVENDSARCILELAQRKQCEIMVFVGNRGCLQIHTGPVNKLLEHGEWYNVLDPMFNLHLNEEGIAHTWVTKKPTEDGIVTALEIFNLDSELIATFFGKRKPGIKELDEWRAIVAQIPEKEVAHVA